MEKTVISTIALLVALIIIFLAEMVYYLKIRNIAKARQIPSNQEAFNFKLPPLNINSLEEIQAIKQKMVREHHKLTELFRQLKEDYTRIDSREREIRCQMPLR